MYENKTTKKQPIFIFPNSIFVPSLISCLVSTGKDLCVVFFIFFLDFFLFVQSSYFRTFICVFSLSSTLQHCEGSCIIVLIEIEAVVCGGGQASILFDGVLDFDSYLFYTIIFFDPMVRTRNVAFHPPIHLIQIFCSRFR